MKKYFICADVHGFYDLLLSSLEKNNFDLTNSEHILIICGDLFDRGNQALLLYKFVKKLAANKRLIYIKGNHEDLLENLLNQAKAGWNISDCHFHNRTIDTFEQLAGWARSEQCLKSRKYFWNPGCWDYQAKSEDDKDIKLRDKGLKKVEAVVNWINKNTLDYAELGNYIFVHGWIPCEKWDKWGEKLSSELEYFSDWRKASSQDWKHARWINGMLAASDGIVESNKIIICGHWHCSYGNYNILHNCDEEHGPNANYDTYKNTGIIALDACTAYTKKINILILTEEELAK